MGGHADESLYRGTIGSGRGLALKRLGIAPGEPTATVWQHIDPTQDNYPGTQIPRSFVIHTDSGSFWTHGNATEHMNEAVTSLKSALGNSNPNLYAQFVLYDYRKALAAATRDGIQYGRMVKSGHWTFKFSRSRSSDDYPVVVHALFTGLV